MADAPIEQPKPNLGVGDLLSGSFNLYFSNFVYFFAIVFFPYLALQLVVNIITYNPDALANAGPGAIAGGVVGYILTMIVFVILQAIVVRSAITVKAGDGTQFGAALNAGAAGAFPIIILSFVMGIAVALGFLLFIVPGLYLLAMFSMLIPAIVFERVGFGGLGRSVSLTSGYRWAILGLLLILLLLGTVVSMVLGGIGGFIAVFAVGLDQMASGTPGLGFAVIMAFATSLANAIVTPILLIAYGLIYARLREIKEGGSIADLVRVFE